MKEEKVVHGYRIFNHGLQSFWKQPDYVTGYPGSPIEKRHDDVSKFIKNKFKRCAAAQEIEDAINEYFELNLVPTVEDFKKYMIEAYKHNSFETSIDNALAKFWPEYQISSHNYLEAYHDLLSNWNPPSKKVFYIHSD